MKRALLFAGILALFIAVHARAATIEVDNSASQPNIFRQGETLISPARAFELGTAGQLVERCTPIKGAVSITGKDTAAFRCAKVKLVLTGKSGTTKWVRL